MAGFSHFNFYSKTYSIYILTFKMENSALYQFKLKNEIRAEKMMVKD